MPTLKIEASALEALRRHADEGYPLEICGFLVGAALDDGRSVREAWPVRNAWEDDPELRRKLFAAREEAGGEASADAWEAADEGRRFLVSPQDILSSMKRARQAGMDLIGVYHSHPNHPPLPSDFDRDAAWPDWSYVIVSVRDGKTADTRSWVLVEDGSRFDEEEIQVSL